MEFKVPIKNDRCYLILFISFLVFLVVSCSKKEDEGFKGLNEAQTDLKKGLYRIELTPQYPKRNSSIRVEVKGINPQDVTYQWMVNGKDIEGATGDTFKYNELRKHDEVRVRVNIKGKGEVISDPIYIPNTPPRILTANLSPSEPRIGDRVSVNISASDEDDDAVELIYSWSINGEPIDATSDSIEIDGQRIKKGDKLSVMITPRDKESNGEPVTLSLVVANSPPDLLKDLQGNIEGFTYTARVMASDPDGDTLTYTLKKSPDGMVIDSKSGLITWKLRPDDKGEHEVTVSVADDSGGEAIINYRIKIGIQETGTR